MHSYYLIKYRHNHRSPIEVLRCLRFPSVATYDERQASLEKWRNNAGRRDLVNDEAMWLDVITVEDAPLP